MPKAASSKSASSVLTPRLPFTTSFSNDGDTPICSGKLGLCQMSFLQFITDKFSGMSGLKWRQIVCNH